MKTYMPINEILSQIYQTRQKIRHTCLNRDNLLRGKAGWRTVAWGLPPSALCYALVKNLEIFGSDQIFKIFWIFLDFFEILRRPNESPGRDLHFGSTHFAKSQF